MPKDLILDAKYMEGYVTKDDLEGILPEIEKAHSFLEKRNGPGGDFLGWMDLPENTKESLLRDIEETSSKLISNSDVIVIIGIGGSYLGARAAIETILPEFRRKKIIFAGHNLSTEHMTQLLEHMKDKDVSVNVISKSGTTTEPSIAFRIIEFFLKKKYGPDDIKERIVCTTDKRKGTLKAIADARGYKTFVIPDDVGGRFSVLTPVGLVPIACAGINIRDIIAGARQQRKVSLKPDIDSNISYRYAADRNILYRKGKRVEVLSNFDGNLQYVSEWWKQLFGESEGKDGKGLFPASCDFTTDLHSMGQLIQDGERILLETFLVIEKECGDCIIPEDRENMDNLNYLAGKHLDFVNKKAYEATASAHFEGGVPNSTVFISEKSPFCLGQLFYFFEKAAALSGYLLGVNPFDQPGVDAYKNKMFKLLGKPGA
ncbi:MAG: glucose-6-phosphate isomerase [Candidatus Omnitrophota bacterium]|jgi:glucose-6-phosphate isomerase